METWPCGPHLLEFEEPDIFHCHIRGPVEEQHARETVRVAKEELSAKRGIRIFFVSHLEDSGANGTFTSSARRYLGSTKLDWRAILIVGGSPVMRLATSIIARATALLSDNKMPTRMLKSMDEVREYIAEARTKDTASPSA